MKRTVITILLVALAATTAHAQGFEQAAAQAVRVKQLDDLVWAFTAACDAGDDVQNRQCRTIRDRKRKELAGATVLVEAEPGAFTAGAWNPQKKSVAMSLTGCVRCTAAGAVVVNGPARRIEGGALRTAALYDNARVFPDEAAAVAWAKTAQTVRVQLVLKVPATPVFQLAPARGLALDLVAFRVVAACTGGIVIAQPPSGPAEADKKACAAATP